MTCTKTILVVEEKSGEFVWHVFWAHNQEVDQMANLGAKGVKKVQMADEINGRRKATRGRWDGRPSLVEGVCESAALFGNMSVRSTEIGVARRNCDKTLAIDAKPGN